MSTPPDNSNRRQHERRILRAVATIVLSPTQAFEVRTIDISAGGMGIVAAANPKPGTSFSIKVPLPMGRNGFVTIEARARVAHSILAGTEQGFKIGLQFVNLDAATIATLGQYLSGSE